MSGTEARQVLRALLRAVDRNITGATGNRQWREFVIAEFRRGEQLADPAERERALQQARDYAFLIHSVREHKELLLSYNIGIPVERREKDMNVRAANMVGLQFPKLE
ncbi:hypothetical protein CHLNCDRAFT_144503 [Chlorella variabilis]|uniref:Complex 1 LYR protein n=1 Tax=Chlorella variabilis TaxID=554065 RepID=E1ZBK1_CHLVA|nr:hypothetical protein CHLNCDRAFT_144503 [Chlorella variabilis]EFN56657.1 hypothetical protein CHLNCDRAFT_144503 [Chlorella variabilis]|eukprot:XP_005848759.1 hypothetical protein CHLNCDRAFT_144503 [Chlorella variabilis]